MGWAGWEHSTDKRTKRGGGRLTLEGGLACFVPRAHTWTGVARMGTQVRVTAGMLCLPEPNCSVVNALGLPRCWASRWLLQRALVDEKGLGVGKDGGGCHYPLSWTGLWSSRSRKVSSRGCSNIPGDGAPHHKGPPALSRDACLLKSLILSQHLLLFFFFKKR